MAQTATDEFEVVWSDPADATLSWSWDKMHNPQPAPPLAAEVIRRRETDVFSGRSLVLNGYVYTSGSTIPPPTPELLKGNVLEVWEQDYVPRIREFCTSLRSADYESMSATELADALDGIIGEAMAVFRYTMVVVSVFGMPANMLADLCEEELGPDGSRIAAALLQGFDNLSAGTTVGLERLADRAAASPAVAAALTEGRFDDVAAAEGGEEFLSDLRKYLDEYGWRAETWGAVHVPTWAQQPAAALQMIARYAADPSLRPQAARDRSVEGRADAERDVERRMRPENAAKMRELLPAARNHVPISEGRAFWQLTIDGSLRVPFLALGSKLVDAGVLDEPNDVMYLSLEELRAVSREATPKQDLVRERKADLARWRALTPPQRIGQPPQGDGMPEQMLRAVTRFWGGNVAQADDASTIKGHAASAGVVRGRARLIFHLSEFGNLQKGEVLVCPSTAPPWTPLFAIAAAVVTDTGGVLSHSAICAREFGIPCVVGTQTATTRIPDGAVVTVDGGEGIVCIEA